MYIQKRILTLSLFFIFTLGLFPVQAAQPSVEALYQDARRHFYALFSSPSMMKDRKKWKRVIRQFEKIAKNRPKSSRADDALYTTGLLYKRLYDKFRIKSDQKNALKSFRGVISRYPKSTLVDEAQKHIGDISFRNSDIKSAVRAFKKASKNKRAVRTKGVGSNKNIARLTAIKRYSRTGYTRLVLHLSGRTAYKAHA